MRAGSLNRKKKFLAEKKIFIPFRVFFQFECYPISLHSARFDYASTRRPCSDFLLILAVCNFFSSEKSRCTITQTNLNPPIFLNILRLIATPTLSRQLTSWTSWWRRWQCWTVGGGRLGVVFIRFRIVDRLAMRSNSVTDMQIHPNRRRKILIRTHYAMSRRFVFPFFLHLHTIQCNRPWGNFVLGNGESLSAAAVAVRPLAGTGVRLAATPLYYMAFYNW